MFDKINDRLKELWARLDELKEYKGEPEYRDEIITIRNEIVELNLKIYEAIL